MPIKEPNRPPSETLEDALSCWRGFMLTHREYTPDKLFVRRTPLNPWAQAFLRYCVSVRLAGGVASAVITRLLANQPALGVKRGRPASWLIIDEQGMPLVAIDRSAVVETSEVSLVNRILSSCLIHEVGHIVCHWWELKSRTGTAARRVLMAPASPAQEEEAWFFSGIVRGLALGWKAREQRDSGGHDEAYLDA